MSDPTQNPGYIARLIQGLQNLGGALSTPAAPASVTVNGVKHVKAPYVPGAAASGVVGQDFDNRVNKAVQDASM